MKVNYGVSMGKYNLLNPSEQSTEVHFFVSDVELFDENFVVNLSMPADDYDYWRDRFNDNWLDALIECGKQWLKRILYSSRQGKVEEILKMLENDTIYEKFHKCMYDMKIAEFDDKIARLQQAKQKWISGS